jgi:hypothetical protein
MLWTEFPRKSFLKLTAVLSGMILFHHTSAVDSFICRGRCISAAESISFDMGFFGLRLALIDDEWVTICSKSFSGSRNLGRQ